MSEINRPLNVHLNLDSIISTQVSLVIPVEGKLYSIVCGRMRGYGDGLGFQGGILCNASLEEYYVIYLGVRKRRNTTSSLY